MVPRFLLCLPVLIPAPGAPQSSWGLVGYQRGKKTGGGWLALHSMLTPAVQTSISLSFVRQRGEDNNSISQASERYCAQEKVL